MSDGLFSGLADKLKIPDIQLNSLLPSSRANNALNTEIKFEVGMGAAKPGFLKPVTLGLAEEFSKKTSAMMCEVNKMCADLAAITPTTALAKNDAAAATPSVPLNELLAQNDSNSDSDPSGTQATKAKEKAKEEKADREAGEKQADRLAKNASDHEKRRAEHASAEHAKKEAIKAEEKREAAV